MTGATRTYVLGRERLHVLEVPERWHQPLLGPAPCATCGAWVEWVQCCGWLALASDELHECEAYLRGAADMAAYPQMWVTPPESEWQRAGRELDAAFAQLRDELATGLQPLLEWLTAPRQWITWRLLAVAALVAVFAALVLVRWQAGLL